MNNNPAVRMIAEWEPQEAVILSLPHDDTDWCDILDSVIDCYKEMAQAIISSGEQLIMIVDDIHKSIARLDGVDVSKIKFIELPTNDTWIRDYGVISVEKNGIVQALDFGFNGWGLKFASDKDNLVNLNLKRLNLFSSSNYVNCRDYVLEGGSLETDGKGTLLTTSKCLCSENRNGGLSKKEVENRLTEMLGFTHYLWLDHGYLAGDDTDSHIDTLARICPNDTILYVGCRDIDDEHFEELTKMRIELENFRTPQGEKYRLIELPMAAKLHDESGDRLPSTYANYLVMNNVVLVPTYNDSKRDVVALEMIKLAYPDRDVVGIDCSILVEQHGSLHCSTMQIPKGLLNLL